jgi:deoxyadenosine/deoxycytidine kinase
MQPGAVVATQEPVSSLIAQTNLRYVAVEGCIGAGKTALSKMLGELIGGQVVLEEFDANPFLKDFYRDPERYAFQTQIFFLLTRYKQQKDLLQADLFHRFLVTDYIFEKDKIFAYLNLQDEELKLYETLVSSIQHSIVTPDLVIYLQSSVPRLMQNIKNRGRGYEMEMSKDYIRDLNAAEMDFVGDERQFNDLVRAIFRPDRAAVEYYNPSKERKP